MKKTPHQRSADNFWIASLKFLFEMQARFTAAGFKSVPPEVIARRFYQFLAFIQRNGLTTRVIVSSREALTPETEFRNHDLTDTGFEFVRHYWDRWVGRTDKDRGEAAEERFLERWHAQLMARQGVS